MARCIVVAYNAPKGQGVATWDDGQLDGDPEILDRAKQVDQVVVQMPGPAEAMDWSNPLHAVSALQEGAERAYGQPIEVFMPEVPASIEPDDAPAEAVY